MQNNDVRASRGPTASATPLQVGVTLTIPHRSEGRRLRRWLKRILLVGATTSVLTGCIFLDVTEKFQPKYLSPEEVRGRVIRGSLVALITDHIVSFSNFNVAADEIPQSCWAYMPFSAGTQPSPNGKTPPDLFIFELPPGTYLVSDPFDTSHGPLVGAPSEPPNSSKFFRRQYIFTIRRGQRFFIGTFTAGEIRDALLQRLDLKTANAPYMQELNSSSFIFAPNLSVRSQHGTEPPVCAVF